MGLGGVHNGSECRVQCGLQGCGVRLSRETLDSLYSFQMEQLLVGSAFKIFLRISGIEILKIISSVS